MTAPKHPGRYDLRPPGSDPPLAEKDTRSIAIDVESKVEHLLAIREKSAAASRAKVVGAIAAAGALLIGMGVVWQQATQTREDVAKVLVVVEALTRDSATTRAQIIEAERGA